MGNLLFTVAPLKASTRLAVCRIVRKADQAFLAGLGENGPRAVPLTRRNSQRNAITGRASGSCINNIQSGKKRFPSRSCFSLLIGFFFSSCFLSISDRISSECQRERANKRCQDSVQCRCNVRPTQDHIMQLHLFVDGLLVRARGSRLSAQDTHGITKLW